MKQQVRLAQDLTLPIDVVTQAIAVIAKRRAGKSYTMRRLTEQLLGAGQQVVIVDPKGDQWGIRSSADGKGAGFPVVILGGERADVPLEPSGGELVAKLVVEERVNVLLDLSVFRKHEVATFMTAFLENLYRLKAKEIYRTPLMLVVDEADAIAPQKPQKGEERMLGAAEDIVRRGGQRGIGCVLVTQRSAVLNKNVLTQAQMLVALRTIAPQDLAAMDAWIQVHGEPEQRKTLMESLPSLPVGDAWFWSPGWPTTDGIFKRVHVLPIETFDSGATPKAGEKRIEPKKAADVDLEALQRQMAATIEKAKADDPRELRKQLATLKSELAKKEAVLAEVDVRTKRIDEKLQRVKQTPALTAADRELLVAFRVRLMAIENELAGAQVELLTEHLKAAEESLRRVWGQFEGIHQTERAKFTKLLESKGFEKILGKLSTLSPEPSAQDSRRPAVPRAVPPTGRSSAATRPNETRAPRGTDGSGAAGDLPKGEQAVLTAVAQYPAGASREQITVLTGYKRSTRDLYLQQLGRRGAVDAVGGDIRVTTVGLDLLGPDFEPLPTGAALIDHWRQRLPQGERAVFDIVVAEHGRPVDRDVITERTGYKRSTRDLYLQKLQRRKLVSANRDGVCASEELFS